MPAVEQSMAGILVINCLKRLTNTNQSDITRYRMRKRELVMTVIEFCRHVELYAWEEYAFEGAALVCERMIDSGEIDITKVSVKTASRKIVTEAGILD